jgi:hypothetical protein
MNIQPPPLQNNNIPVVNLVQQDLIERSIHGKNKYGDYLRSHNGRNALQDLYEELLDACCYLKQRLTEEKNDIS